MLHDACLKRQHCCRHLHAVFCHTPLELLSTSKVASPPSAAAAVNHSPVMFLSRSQCLQDARVLQQQLATETSLRQNAMEDYRAMQSQLVALSGDLDVSQQKQRALQQQLAAEQVGSQSSREAVEWKQWPSQATHVPASTGSRRCSNSWVLSRWSQVAGVRAVLRSDGCLEKPRCLPPEADGADAAVGC